MHVSQRSMVNEACQFTILQCSLMCLHDVWLYIPMVSSACPELNVIYHKVVANLNNIKFKLCSENRIY